MSEATPHAAVVEAWDAVVARRVALVGYGEVGRIFAAGLTADSACSVRAYDIQVGDASWAADARERAAHDRVAVVGDVRDAVADADLVICAVTAASTAVAAASIADACRSGTYVLDVNSASPQTKTRCAERIGRSGGRYVEAAVMSSVPPHGLQAPMLLGGPHAEALQPTLIHLGFRAKVGATNYGVVSAIKLCRSVFVKGMEALAVEGLLAARRYGVEREVLASLTESFPGFDWERQASYFWRRVARHGRRRAEEMREAAATVDDAGVAPRMTSSTADVQAWMASLGAAGAFAGVGSEAGWRELADRVARDDDR